VNVYRAYFLNEEDHIVRRVDLKAAEDHAALEEARKMLDGQDIEIWHGGKKILRLPHKG
jgi:hypothetical protein